MFLIDKNNLKKIIGGTNGNGLDPYLKSSELFKILTSGNGVIPPSKKQD